MDSSSHYTHTFPSLASAMKVDIAVNPAGGVLLAYDMPFPIAEKPSWVEFWSAEQSLKFFTKDGTSRDLGMTVHKPIGMHLMKGKQVDMVCVQNNKITQAFSVPLVIQDKE